jgi:hypothetical protein
MPSTRPLTGKVTFPQPVSELGIELSSCSYLRPACPVETNLVIEVNRGDAKSRGMKRTPAEACPPMHMRPKPKPDLAPLGPILGDVAVVPEDGPVPDKDIVTRVRPPVANPDSLMGPFVPLNGRNGHHGNG